MAVIRKTRLRIREQGELLNQIAGTYKDFFRAAMEYVDNAVDAAAMLQQNGELLTPALTVHVDTARKRLSFTDNCGGMSPEELCDLLSEVGRSKKKAVPWANGQFGFGVHAFRAFAREAVFVSRKKGQPEAKIRIDRTLDETADVSCETTDEKQLEKPGTRVLISRFDPHVFKKNVFVNALVSEIEHHFDDVLRVGVIKIAVAEDDAKPYQCKFFDFSKLPGVTLQKEFFVGLEGARKHLTVDLKILDRVQDNRLPVLTNKQRRVQTIADLKSYKIFLRGRGEKSYVWSNPFVTGSIELNSICSPNLTRDDLRDSPAREAVFECLVTVQKELEVLVDQTMNNKKQESLRKLGRVMSDCLDRILRNFNLTFEKLTPSLKPGTFDQTIFDEMGDVAFGGDEFGGGGPGPNWHSSAGTLATSGNSGVGENTFGGGPGDIRKSKTSGLSAGRLVNSAGPHIEFQNHAGENRVIDLGNSLIINTQHPDFIKRNTGGSGTIKLDARLLNYVSMVIAPPCVHKLFERRGKVPTALEAGNNIVDLGMRLEQELVATMLGQQLETTA